MRVHRVVAEELDVAPLFTEGPLADLRFKFVLIEDELVYGNVRHHWDLVGWLLQGPLSAKYPVALARARPIIEAEHVLTVFGGVGPDGEIETAVYITPDSMTTEGVEHLVAETIRMHLLMKEVA